MKAIKMNNIVFVWDSYIFACVIFNASYESRESCTPAFR